MEAFLRADGCRVEPVPGRGLRAFEQHWKAASAVISFSIVVPRERVRPALRALTDQWGDDLLYAAADQSAGS
jgi:hypothetical protein